MMRRATLTIICACILATPLAAATVHSRSGAAAHVAAGSAHKFRCVIRALERAGYPIRFMGGIRPGHCWSGGKHPCGRALDINQYSRDVTRPPMPRNANALARACGLLHGGEWRRSPDRGHFED